MYELWKVSCTYWEITSVISIALFAVLFVTPPPYSGRSLQRYVSRRIRRIDRLVGRQRYVLEESYLSVLVLDSCILARIARIKSGALDRLFVAGIPRPTPNWKTGPREGLIVHVDSMSNRGASVRCGLTDQDRPPHNHAGKCNRV
ncbi:hypothetical protein K491DRAFT_142457 [Lophiostoma macrostomum CBS 122681]|uniref:Uncharacterized protein n=1 Tax=Lophiostoma macrostomum CBS 122681 TaxID=1314788 RepID=A0A6A6SUK3_9PLEO|nr:hypothetical protein K491DRAFT_142457 [Lophiostoma macrostomum CBS 122681]